jgi:thioredoxin-dependent peroxiredoxin
MGAAVLGVSADDVESHGEFHGKFGLNFPLLADPELAMVGAYGAWGKYVLFGNEYEGVLRHTYLIDPKGEVAHVWEEVDAEVHALEVAKVLGGLQKA